MPTNFGFYIVFTDTKFLLDFASSFNGVKCLGHILHLELIGQLEVQRASFKTELEKSEKLAHA